MSVFALRVQLRALAAFALVLLLGQYVLPSLHHAFQAHEICPEHGELVHADEHAAAIPASKGSGIVADSARHEHGHCAVVPAVSREGQAVATPSSLDVLPPAVATATTLCAPRILVPKTALYRLAPKQSPPV